MEKSLRTGIVFDSNMTLHQCGRKHPERPQRVTKPIQQLLSKNFHHHPKVEYLNEIPPASKELILMAHGENYYHYVSNIWPQGVHKSHIMILDTYFNQHSKQASQIAVGGVVLCVDKMMGQKWGNAFAVVRPPGHHTGFRSVINGFCVYNNVAVGVKHLQKKYGLKRILIFDWDVHHGDGTQHIFREDPSVLFVSLHRYDHASFYPGESGDHKNAGIGKAQGFQINVPWNTKNKSFKDHPETPGDNEYIYTFQRLLSPIIKEFNPEFIMVSAGFDSARGDPLGGLRVSPDCYHYLTTRLMDICPRVLVVLEGGYNVTSIANSVEGVVQALLRQDISVPENSLRMDQKKQKCWLPDYYHRNVDEIVDFFRKYWPVLQSQQLQKYQASVKENTSREYGIYQHESSSESSEDQRGELEVEFKLISKQVGKATTISLGNEESASKLEDQPEVNNNPAQVSETKEQLPAPEIFNM